jgi:hypothetical protein
MSLYQHTQTAEVRDLAPELIAGWAASGNPKGALWVPYTPPPEVPVAPQVPVEVSNQQLRLALIEWGIMPSAILAQLQALPEGAQKEKALAAWEYANYFRRDHPLVLTLAGQMGLTAAQVDALFILAETLG